MILQILLRLLMMYLEQYRQQKEFSDVTMSVL